MHRILVEEKRWAVMLALFGFKLGMIPTLLARRHRPSCCRSLAMT